MTRTWKFISFYQQKTGKSSKIFKNVEWNRMFSWSHSHFSNEMSKQIERLSSYTKFFLSQLFYTCFVTEVPFIIYIHKNAAAILEFFIYGYEISCKCENISCSLNVNITFYVQSSCIFSKLVPWQKSVPHHRPFAELHFDSVCHRCYCWYKMHNFFF